MKKPILFLFIFLCFYSINVKSQTLVDTNNIWYVYYHDNLWNGNTNIYKFIGDTTFGSCIYKKLYAAYDDPTITQLHYIYAMREDSTNKVYVNSGSGDILYYDFGLSTNDTFNFQGHKMLVDSVKVGSKNSVF